MKNLLPNAAIFEAQDEKIANITHSLKYGYLQYKKSRFFNVCLSNREKGKIILFPSKPQSSEQLENMIRLAKFQTPFSLARDNGIV